MKDETANLPLTLAEAYRMNAQALAELDAMPAISDADLTRITSRLIAIERHALTLPVESALDVWRLAALMFMPGDEASSTSGQLVRMAHGSACAACLSGD